MVPRASLSLFPRLQELTFIAILVQELSGIMKTYTMVTRSIDHDIPPRCVERLKAYFPFECSSS